MLNRRLRLIHSGRLLTNDTLLHPWLTPLEGRQKRVETEDGDTGSVNAVAATTARPATMWFHCSVGQVMAPDDPEEEDRLQVTSYLHLDNSPLSIPIQDCANSTDARFR